MFRGLLNYLDIFIFWFFIRFSALFKPNRHLPTNTTNLNAFDYRISEEVTEIHDGPIVQNQGQAINDALTFRNSQNVQSGGTIPVPEDHQFLRNMLVKIYRWVIRRRRSVFLLLFIIFLGYASAENIQAIKCNQMYHGKAIEQNALSTNVSFNENWAMKTNETHFKMPFDGTYIVQVSINLSYPIVESFQPVISKLFNWKGNGTKIIHDKSHKNKSVLGYELKNMSHSISTAVRALGQLLSFAKNSCADIVNNIVEHQRSIANKYFDLEQSSSDTLRGEESDSKCDNEIFFYYDGDCDN